jgi:Gnt-I system low-affinity gluconate transporter
VGADLGWVIIAGILAGLPAALICGMYYGKYISGKIIIQAPAQSSENYSETLHPGIALTFSIIALPIILIILNSLVKSSIFFTGEDSLIKDSFHLIGHPFTALIIANILAWYFLGIKKGISKIKLFEISARSMAPAGSIILLTGAGGVFKQVLTDSGTGKIIAELLAGFGFPVIIFAFLAAAAIRILQGSATVAMITSASLVAPSLPADQMRGFDGALIVISIAAGASIMSHVNDSGFWLVKQYLNLSEKETFRSWTVLTTLIAVTGFVIVMMIKAFTLILI